MSTPSRSLVRRFWYQAVRFTCRVFVVLLFRFRSFRADRVPKSGAVLLLANHQSYLDPVLVGVACRRPTNSLARKSLFEIPGLAWLIRSIDTIPIDRDGKDISGLKETLRRLRRGEMMLLFPEGRRSDDGEVATLKPGFCALARRSKATILPIGIDGAFDAWPRKRSLPRLRQIRLFFGEPITAEEFGQQSDEQLVRLVSERIRDCQAAARGQLRKTV